MSLFGGIYEPGNRWIECDVCGLDMRFNVVRKGIMGNQLGLNVCPPCFDQIHPREERIKSRPEGRLEEVM